jgi:hypothetical protein
VARSCLPTTIEVGQKGPVRIVPGFSSFKLVIPPSAMRGGTISGMEYMVPLPLAAGGN